MWALRLGGTAKILSHYIIERRPNQSEGDVLDEVSRLLEEQDANALGLNVVWIDDYAVVPGFLTEVATANQVRLPVPSLLLQIHNAARLTETPRMPGIMVQLANSR